MTKLILTILCLTIIGIINASSVKEQACAGAPDIAHSFVPNPISCNHYILCMNGTAHNGNCPPGYHFNVKQQNCDLEGSVDCTQCAAFGVVNLAHKTECNKYYECMFGQRTERTCGAGLYFDRNVGTCNLAQSVQCQGTGGGNTTPPPVTGPTVPPTQQPTQPPVTTVPTTQTPSVTPPGPDPILPVCIPGGQIHHSHPKDCRRYFMCVNGILWEHLCPSELHWNERAMACDKPENAKCVRSSGLTINNDMVDFIVNEDVELAEDGIEQYEEIVMITDY